MLHRRTVPIWNIRGDCMSTKKPIVAMMYDFDKTLCSKNMQEYSFIPNMGLSEEEFWTAANELSKSLQMDGILA